MAYDLFSYKHTRKTEIPRMCKLLPCLGLWGRSVFGILGSRYFERLHIKGIIRSAAVFGFLEGQAEGPMEYVELIFGF